jgi:hypothetical protein
MDEPYELTPDGFKPVTGQKLCDVCHGKGTIDNPACYGRAMAYCGPNGERFPQVRCRGCGGEGWIPR